MRLAFAWNAELVVNPRIGKGENVFYTFVGSHNRDNKVAPHPGHRTVHNYSNHGDGQQKNGASRKKDSPLVGGMAIKLKKHKPAPGEVEAEIPEEAPVSHASFSGNVEQPAAGESMPHHGKFSASEFGGGGKKVGGGDEI